MYDNYMTFYMLKYISTNFYRKKNFEPQLVKNIISYLSFNLDKTLIKNKINSICMGKVIQNKDIDWLIRYYIYFSKNFQDIKHNREDILIYGGIEDNFDNLFELSLSKVVGSSSGKTIKTIDIEREFHPFVFFKTENLDYGRAPRMRILKL